MKRWGCDKQARREAVRRHWKDGEEAVIVRKAL